MADAVAAVSPSVALAEAPALPSVEAGRLRWLRAAAGNLKAALGGLILLCVVVAAVGAPAITTIDPNFQTLSDRLQGPMVSGRTGVFHLLGTDQLGRDLFARILYGARVSLVIGLVAVCIAGTLGVSLGLLAGMRGGRTEDVVMRLADMQLSLPFILIATALAAVLGPGLQNTVLVLGVNSWVSYARVVRAGALSVREREYVLAARALGIGEMRVIRRYVLPNIASPVIVIATFAVAQMILGEATLTFLGLGTPVDIPSWGAMLSESRNYMTVAWWTVTFPGLAITATVIGINLFGDWLRDYLDPKNRDLV